MTYYGLCASVVLSNLNNVNCLQYGLGSKEQSGEQILNIYSENGGGSSILYHADEVIATEKIQVKTLDDFNLSNICFIKMDIESNESYALQGAKLTLARSDFPPILFEANNDADYDKTSDVLFELKYSIFPVHGTTNMYLATYEKKHNVE